MGFPSRLLCWLFSSVRVLFIFLRSLFKTEPVDAERCESTPAQDYEPPSLETMVRVVRSDDEAPRGRVVKGKKKKKNKTVKLLTIDLSMPTMNGSVGNHVGRDDEADVEDLVEYVPNISSDGLNDDVHVDVDLKTTPLIFRLLVKKIVSEGPQRILKLEEIVTGCTTDVQLFIAGKGGLEKVMSSFAEVDFVGGLAVLPSRQSRVVS